MRTLTTLLFVTFAMAGIANAQNLSPEIQAAGKRVDQAFDDNLKRWTREGPVVPAYPGENVLIEFWRTNDRNVKVAIMPLRAGYTQEDLFRTPDVNKKKLEGIGDAAIQFGFGDKIVWFIRGPFYVAVSSDVQLNLFSKNKDENEVMSRAEAAATSRLIACFVNLALNGDLEKNKVLPKNFLSKPCEQDLVFKGILSDETIRRLYRR